MIINDELVSQFTPFLILATALYMIFIVWNLARESQAGRYGTFIMFAVLCGGLTSFFSKMLIEFAMISFHLI